MLWQYKIRDKESDFYPAEDIQRMFRDDELKKDTMVRPQNSSNWVPLGTVPDLKPPREGTSKARFALENVSKRAEENAKMLDLPDSMTKYISPEIMKKRLDKDDEDRPKPVSITNLPRLTEEERQIMNENRSATIRIKNTNPPRAVEAPPPPASAPARAAPFPVRSPQQPAPAPSAPPEPDPVRQTRPSVQVQGQSQIPESAKVRPHAPTNGAKEQKLSKVLALAGAGLCALSIVGAVLLRGGELDFVAFGLGLLFGLGFYPLTRFYVFHR